jgi:hypothetical protein
VAKLLGSTAAPELKAHLIRVLVRLPRELIRARAYEILRVYKRNQLREVRCPMLCLHGQLDRLVSKKYVDEILSAKPECQVHWFAAPRMLLETHPDNAANVINQFCLRLNCLHRGEHSPHGFSSPNDRYGSRCKKLNPSISGPLQPDDRKYTAVTGSPGWGHIETCAAQQETARSMASHGVPNSRWPRQSDEDLACPSLKVHIFSRGSSILQFTPSAANMRATAPPSS